MPFISDIYSKEWSLGEEEEEIFGAEKLQKPLLNCW